MRSTVKSLILLATAISFLSCTTTNLAKDKNTLSAFCENGRAKVQSVFVVAAYNGIPKGTAITSVNRIVESNSSESDFIKNHFIQALLVYGYSDNPSAPLAQNGVLHNVFFQRFGHGYSPVLPHLAWLKNNKFAICKDANCNGMKYPESPSDIVEFDSQKWDDGRCHDFFIEDGYVSGLGCRGNAFGLLNFMKATGFNDGWLLLNSYIQVPEHQKTSLCIGAGLSSDCFNIFNSKDQFYKFRQTISANVNLKSDFAFLMSFNGVLDGDIALIEAKSAFAKDLILKAGTKISTKVTKDWAIHRITWDPSLLCKYGHSNDDFNTH